VEVPVGRRDEADIDGRPAVSPSRITSAVWMTRRRPGLHRARDLADFIEEERVALHGFESAEAVGRSPGKNRATKAAKPPRVRIGIFALWTTD
jgi:hypothetical protein